MKHSKKLTPIIAILMLVATTVPAYALDVGVMTNTNTTVKVDDGRQYKVSDERNDDDTKSESEKNDDKNDNRGGKSLEHRNDIFTNRIKSWMVSAGTLGEVTAVTANSLTIKNSAGEIYTVTTTDATIRRGEKESTSPIVVGETVFALCIKNANTIVASMIIVGKTKDDVKPTTEEKRQSYFGAITAKTATSLTVLSSSNISYTVNLATDAKIWINQTKQADISGFVVGDNVMVQGALSGTTISAKRLMTVHLPAGTIIGKVTASSSTTLTVLASDNKTYTVLTTDASVKAKGKDGTIAVGDVVVVKGDLVGTTLTAQTVTEGKSNNGFFSRFSSFFKGIFGKK